MEELLELKQLLQHGEINSALELVDELEEMGRKGIASNIRSYFKVLLLHLIKQQIEKRSTKSWEASIHTSVAEIQYLNQRPKGKGVYLTNEELKEVAESAWNSAVVKASLEAMEGIYDARAIAAMVDKDEVTAQALVLVGD